MHFENEASAPEITGKTRVLGILAHPTDHVKAPPLINRIARQRARDAVMVPFNVASEHLAQLVGALRTVKSFNGSIVTVPHKQAILALCDDVSPQARAVGAANVIRLDGDGRIIGAQLDGIGFINGLRHEGVDVAGKDVHLTGAGGAASAIAFAIGEAGAKRLTLNNRSRQKIEQTRGKLADMFPEMQVILGSADPAGHDIIINGTTLGMKPGDALPVDVSRLSPGMVVAEVIMDPEITPLLAAAEAAGCRIHLGRHMLDHQLQLMADFLGL